VTFIKFTSPVRTILAVIWVTCSVVCV